MGTVTSLPRFGRADWRRAHEAGAMGAHVRTVIGWSFTLVLALPLDVGGVARISRGEPPRRLSGQCARTAPDPPDRAVGQRWQGHTRHRDLDRGALHARPVGTYRIEGCLTGHPTVPTCPASHGCVRMTNPATTPRHDATCTRALARRHATTGHRRDRAREPWCGSPEALGAAMRPQSRGARIQR
jgi:hypothetical protein